MRTTRPYLWATPIVLLAAACSGGPERATSDRISSDLRRDLELAQAAQLELASARRGGTDIASAIEVAHPGEAREGDRESRPTPRRQSPPAPAPSRRPTPDARAQAPVADDASVTEAPTTGMPAATIAEDASPEQAEEPAAADEPVVLAGPNATPEGVGTSRPRDPGGWGDGDLGGLGGGGGIGGGGVVIRGGTIGDDDHCEIRPRGGIPIRIGQRYPGYPSGPIYGGNIPSRGTGTVDRSGGRTRVGSGSTIRSRGGASSVPRALPSGGGSTTRRRM